MNEMFSALWEEHGPKIIKVLFAIAIAATVGLFLVAFLADLAAKAL
jgi:hypothetical protein